MEIEKDKKLKHMSVEELEKKADAVSIEQRKTGPPDDGRPDKENAQLNSATNHGKDLGVLKDQTAGD
jgi:hypothetical protein